MFILVNNGLADSSDPYIKDTSLILKHMYPDSVFRSFITPPLFLTDEGEHLLEYGRPPKTLCFIAHSWGGASVTETTMGGLTAKAFADRLIEELRKTDFHPETIYLPSCFVGFVPKNPDKAFPQIVTNELYLAGYNIPVKAFSNRIIPGGNVDHMSLYATTYSREKKFSFCITRTPAETKNMFDIDEEKNQLYEEYHENASLLLGIRASLKSATETKRQDLNAEKKIYEDRNDALDAKIKELVKKLGTVITFTKPFDDLLAEMDGHPDFTFHPNLQEKLFNFEGSMGRIFPILSQLQEIYGEMKESKAEKEEKEEKLIYLIGNIVKNKVNEFEGKSLIQKLDIMIDVLCEKCKGLDLRAGLIAMRGTPKITDELTYIAAIIKHFDTYLENSKLQYINLNEKIQSAERAAVARRERVFAEMKRETKGPLISADVPPSRPLTSTSSSSTSSSSTLPSVSSNPSTLWGEQEKLTDEKKEKKVEHPSPSSDPRPP